MNPADEELVREALRLVVAPEGGVNIAALGLVYGIEATAAGVKVQMTMTSAACPMADMIVDEVHAALEGALPVHTPVEVDLVWDPPWTPERMSGLARERPVQICSFALCGGG